MEKISVKKIVNLPELTDFVVSSYRAGVNPMPALRAMNLDCPVVYSGNLSSVDENVESVYNVTQQGIERVPTNTIKALLRLQESLEGANILSRAPSFLRESSTVYVNGNEGAMVYLILDNEVYFLVEETDEGYNPRVLSEKEAEEYNERMFTLGSRFEAAVDWAYSPNSVLLEVMVEL